MKLTNVYICVSLTIHQKLAFSCSRSMDFLICYLIETACNLGDSLITYFKEIISHKLIRILLGRVKYMN